jgi:hemoglobin
MTDTAIHRQREQLRAELAEHTMYELLGGADGIRSIVDHFYDLMDGERFAPIRSMHAPDLGHMRVGLFEFPSG